MSTLSDSDSPSLPSDFDETLTGPDRLIKLIKNDIIMIHVLQHKARKWIRKREAAQVEQAEGEQELNLLLFQMTKRIATEEEWMKWERLDDEQRQLLSYIKEAREGLDETMERIDELMDRAWHYMNVLEESNDDTWMECDH